MKQKISKIMIYIIMVILLLNISNLRASAKEITDETSETTIVSYGMSEGFIVTIPERLRISYYSDTGEMDISASNVMIGHGKTLEVSISSENYNNRWRLEYTRTPYMNISYRIGTEEYGNDISNGDIVLSVPSGQYYNSTKTETLYFYVSGTLKYAGTYKDYLTFTASIK